ncbi:autotransporter-associated beta strand repeat-containing protein [Luteolibacter sp.]|uniref:beta strand repeat-containing protein n=1 Tax=Luteolibacter sp. TaxID=1962973 RepID=UPI003265DA0E
MKPNRFVSSITALTSCVLAFSAVSSAQAALITWNGGTGSWDTTTNWTPSNLPTSSDTAVFGGTAGTVTAAAAQSVLGMQLTSSGYTLAGAGLTVGTGGIDASTLTSGTTTVSSNLTLLSGFQQWKIGAGGALAITGTVTRNAGASVNFSTTGITSSTLANDATGILGGWATVGNAGTTGATGDWAANDGSGNIITYSGYTNITAATGAGSYSAQNWKVTNAAASLTASATVNSLVVTTDFSISSGATMTLGSGGMILSGASKWFKNNGAGSTAGTGQLTSGLGSGELFIDSSASGGAGDNDWRIWTKIVDNGGTAVKLVKNGPGYLRLANSNTYTGGTIMNGGTLVGDGGSSFGTGAVQVNSGAVSVNLNAGTMANNFTVATGSSATIDNATNNGTLNGSFSGGGTVTIQNTSANNLSENVNGSWSGFTGILNYNTSGKVVNIFAPASMDLSTATVNFANTGNLTNSSFRTSATGTTKFGSLAGFGYMEVNGATEIGNLGTNTTFSGVMRNAGSIAKVGTGTLTLSGASAYTGATAINGGTLQVGNGTTGSIAGGSAVTIGASGTLAINLAAAGTFSNSVTNSGSISAISANDMTLSSAITGAGSLQKSGAGTLTVSAFSDFTGPTTVSAGTLKVTGSISGSALSLGAGTLTGTGFVGGVTVNNSAAVISNGNSNTATLYLDSLSFSTAGTFNLNKDALNPAIAISNNLNIGSGFTVNVTSAPSWISGQTYDLITFGSRTGLPVNVIQGTVPGLGARQFATIGTTANSITLTISGVTPVWTGVASGTWSTTTVGTPFNWKTDVGGASTQFQTNDSVLFNDTATGTTNVTINDNTVSPAVTTFDNSGVDNSGVDYTLTGSGGINTGSLNKLGTGTVTISTTNSYTGATSIQGGILQLGNGSANGDISTSSGIANDATLVYNRTGGSFTYANVISGIGTVVKNGTGTQILTGTNTYSGGTTINAGILQMGNGGAAGRLGTGAITDNASLVFNRSDTAAQGTDFGAIDGTGSVTQNGAGTLTLSSFNSYSGGTNLNSGTIVAGSNNALGTGLVTLNSGTLSGSTTSDYTLANALTALPSTTSVLLTIGKNLAINGNLSGSGNINRNATGGASSVFLGGDNSGFTGTFTIENNANAATRFTSATSGSANAKWVINQPTSTRASVDSPGGTIHMGSLTGTGFVTAQGIGTTTLQVGNLGITETFPGVLNQLAGTSVLAVTKVGAGTWTLTGTNTYTGDTTVNAGVLAVDGDAIANTNKLLINGGKVDPMGATEVVNTLYFGAAQQASGTWGASGSGAAHIDDTHFTGTGMVSVTTAPAGYTSWADANGATSQTMDMDHDNDGVRNGIEYFMGQIGSTFTANPASVSGTVTWPMGATYTGVYGTDYEVQTSTDLVTWTQVPVGTGDNTVTVTAGTSVVYDMPTGGKNFVRLVVKN